MRVILVAGGLLALAGLALGASLMPSGRINPVYVSIGAPGVPAVVAQAPAPKAPTSAAAASSIARAAGQQVEAVAPVIAAPPPVRSTSTSTSAPSAPADLGPRVQQPPAHCHGDKKFCPRPG